MAKRGQPGPGARRSAPWGPTNQLICLLENKKVCWFLGFLVSQFVVVLVSKFPGFLVSWLLGFKLSLFQSFKDSKIPYYQMPISCFLEDINLIYKLPTNFKTNLNDLSVLVFSELSMFLDFPTFEIYEH